MNSTSTVTVASSTVAVTSSPAASVISYTTTSTSYQSSTAVSSTPTIITTTTSSTATPSVTSTPISSTTPAVSPTPTPQSHCTANTSDTNVGLLVWPHTAGGRSVSIPCPYGPPDALSTRHCVLISATGDAVWGVLELGACFTANNWLQLLEFEVRELKYLYLFIIYCLLHFRRLLIAMCCHYQRN